MEKHYTITVLVIILLLLAAVGIAIFSQLYGKSSVVATGMSTLFSGEEKQPSKALRDPGIPMPPDCGNGLCGLDENHKNCPEDC